MRKKGKMKSDEEGPGRGHGMEGNSKDRIRSTLGGVEERSRDNRKLRKPPKTAAVTITDVEESGEILKYAREKISLLELGIERSKVRRAANGGVLIEIPGPDGVIKADRLANKLREVVKDKAIISRPVVKGEMRILDLDNSVTKEEIYSTIVEIGECKEEEIKVGDIKIMANGLGTLWTQCPLHAAVRVVSKGKLRIGWTMACTELLKARPLQCFRWQTGHVKFNCKAREDRSRLCFRCGMEGHVARFCQGDPYCHVCAKGGKECGHRMIPGVCDKVGKQEKEGNMEWEIPKKDGEAQRPDQDNDNNVN